MLYKQKFETFIGSYPSFGYIVNKNKFKNLVTNEIGSIFLKALTREPKELEKITDEIVRAFSNADPSTVQQDVIEFYNALEEDGFIVSGQTPAELEQKDSCFSYAALCAENLKEQSSAISRANQSSKKCLDEYCKKNPQLISFQVELTSCCNERCVHCYIPHKNKIASISPELFYDVLKQCKEMGVMDLTLSGGEPMLHPNFLNFLQAAKRNGFAVTVLTNLTLLNDEIIATLKEISLSFVQVSLYSMNPEIHDTITQMPGSFVKTKAAIFKLIENNIPLQISCPSMRENKDSFAEVAKWAAQYGIRVITDYIMMARYDRSTDNLEHRISLEETEPIINSIIENDFAYRLQIAKTDFKQIPIQNVDEELMCGVGFTSLCMSADGTLYPCAGWHYKCGDIREQALQKIWINSPELKKLRQLRKKDMKNCASCENYDFCAVCMARNANENPDGDPLKINPHFCKLAELNKKIVLEWKNKL